MGYIYDIMYKPGKRIEQDALSRKTLDLVPHFMIVQSTMDLIKK